MMDSSKKKESRKGEKGLPSVWNRPIDPTSHPDFESRKIKPVTVEELGGHYLTAGMRNFERKGDQIDMEILEEDLNRWYSPQLLPGKSAPDLMHHNFGKALWLNLGFLKASNWQEAMKEIKRRGLYIYDCWGTIPGCRDFKEGGLSAYIPEEVHRQMIEILGPNFLGWDNGENDGRWFWQVMRVSPAVTDRKEAYQYFLGWFQRFFSEYLHNYVTSLCGLTYPHYFAKMDGQRLIGAEFVQGLPSIPMWSAFVRGAARQYQMLWFSGTSIWTYFGYKSFEADAYNKINYWTDLGLGLGNPSAQGGPDRGPTISLLKRVWYLLFMYGTNIQTMETSQFYRPAGPIQPSIPQADRTKEDLIAPEAKKEFLSPLGKMQLDATAFCEQYKERRGVQYCPVAALLDFYSGWSPPRHMYTDSFYLVWGGIPYQPGDHQIDLFFREIFPGYQDCPYFRDERGFLTPTPYGDIVDLLLSDVHPKILDRYPLTWVLGEIKVEGSLFQRLKRYVERGRTIIWSINQLSREGLDFSGVVPSEKRIKAKETRAPATGRVYQEPSFTLPLVRIKGAKVLLETKSGHPVIVKKRRGKGEVITIIPPFGLSDRIPENHPLIGGDPQFDTHTFTFFDKPIGSPYRFLTGVKDIIFPYLSKLNLIEVTASLDPFTSESQPKRPIPIQYLTNLTSDPDRILVTLVNNEPVIAYTRLKVKKAKIERAIDLLHGEREVCGQKTEFVDLTLFPSDSADFHLYILELKVDRPIVHFMEG